MSEITRVLKQKESSKTTFPERPLLTVLFKPRSTIRAIVDCDSKRYVIILAFLVGIGNAFKDGDMLIMLAQAFGLLMGVILTVIAGGFFGLIGLFVFGALFTWTGIGGKASSAEVRAAMAWSGAPAIISLFLAPLMLLLYRTGRLSTTSLGSSSGTYFLVAALGIIVNLWWGFLFWKCYAEVQQFSLLRAFMTIILGIVTLSFVLLILSFLFSLTMILFGS